MFVPRSAVAPRVGAWIETPSTAQSGSPPLSLPVWERGLKRIDVPRVVAVVLVAPRVGAWIETPRAAKWCGSWPVAPRVGAWIETTPPPRPQATAPAAPRVGAWIETCPSPAPGRTCAVAPRVGAWIETPCCRRFRRCRPSLPVWERGLKPQRHQVRQKRARVAPRVGAWIETVLNLVLRILD